MKICFIVDSPYAFQNGIWYHRNHTPSTGLEKRGHGVKFVALAGTIPEEIIQWPDTVIFGRIYHPELKPLEAMRKFKAAGKRVLYDLDDDFWSVNPDNPSVLVSSSYKDQYESFIREADALVSPSRLLGNKMLKIAKKPVFVCPNSINYEVYKERKREHDRLIIGYSGASSHWKDLAIIAKPLVELRKKYDFVFVLYGIVGGPMESEMYNYDQLIKRRLQPEKEPYFKSALDWYEEVKALPELWHIPFHAPQLHPLVLARCDFDIGLAPLYDCDFNRAKSNIKFYEYAAVGTVTLASDVIPYKEEVGYCAKNNFNDWYKKLEKLITDKKFRKELLAKQQKFVKENKSMERIALEWELACQLPGGLPVKSQYEKNLFNGV